MLNDDPLGLAGRPRGIDDVASSIDRRPDLVRGEGRVWLGIDGLVRGIEKDAAHVERAESRAEVGHRYDGFDARVRQDEANALCRETRIERHIGGVDLHHRQQREIGLDRFVEQKTDPIAGFNPPVDQVARDLVGALVEVAIGDDRLVGDDRVVCPEAPTGLLQEMMKPLALLPTNGAVLAGQYRGASDRSFEASGRDGQVMDTSEMRDAVRRGCRAT